MLAIGPACEREGIEERTVDKGVEDVPEAAESPPPPSTAESEAPSPEQPGDPAAAWSVPDDWTRDPEPRAMRVATYIVPAAAGAVEVAVTRFGGRVGGELANINRWRGQMGLEPIDASRLDAAVTRFETPGYEGYEVRIESSSGVMLAAGVYDESIDQTWFVRTTLPDPEAADRLGPGVFGLARSIGARGGG